MSYINGNLAMQPKRKPDQKTVVRETKRVLVKRKTLPTQEKLLYLFSVIAVVLVLGAILVRQTQIYGMSVQIKQMTNEYESMNVEMKELKKQVEMLSDPERVSDLAKKQGMVESNEPIIVNTGADETESAMRE
ncbi:FtsL-like putative cell division protein [Paenibacillus sp. NEAU-GSW1]|uniref:FtsL-like putative cell division protein n=1 Tax=Paenibacillus sp. NEAU-GSW1 TaxID=2682486 RepID=UPI0012E15697|nr:FtsL-like putative cell division protein [Paenibacillus sp. NEAU-GSW1]MUT66198.1 cell division initiation protein [Paenibacillus sp. NEAU-GSW1]